MTAEDVLTKLTEMAASLAFGRAGNVAIGTVDRYIAATRGIRGSRSRALARKILKDARETMMAELRKAESDVVSLMRAKVVTSKIIMTMKGGENETENKN